VLRNEGLKYALNTVNTLPYRLHKNYCKTALKFPGTIILQFHWNYDHWNRFTVTSTQM